MDYEEYKRKVLEPIVKYIESAMASYSKEEIEARIKKALPEKESEDERIRRQIEQALIEHDWSATYKVSKDDCLAYLEKQKEHFRDDTKMVEQQPAEWSKEDEKMFNSLCTVLRGGLSSIPTEQFISWLKSLRPLPQQNMSIGFMLYLDEHRPDGKMCLSNAECNQLEIAFRNQDWGTILKYAEKYHPHWKPSKEQMTAIESAYSVLKAYDTWDEDEHLPALASLVNDLQKLL